MFEIHNNNTHFNKEKCCFVESVENYKRKKKKQKEKKRENIRLMLKCNGDFYIQ